MSKEKKMKDAYYVDLTQITLEQFQHTIETEELLPSQQVLLEDIEARFATLAAQGMGNVAELHDVLKTKARMVKFAASSGLPEDYLIILRRKVTGYLPKPVPLAKIPGVDPAHVAALADVGIKHTKHVFEQAPTPAARAALIAQTRIPEDALLELVKLSDLARIYGMGPVFMRLFYDAGADSLAALLTWQPEDLDAKMRAINEECQLTKARWSMKDIVLTIEAAKQLPKVIVYN
jgi:predicted flap endonuclease-1-like 5' DNA nuclease